MFSISKNLRSTPFLFLLTVAMCAMPAHAQNYSVLYDFESTPDGQLPVAGVLERNGVLYGTTQEAGSFDVEGAAGTVFSFDISSGKETVLHTFGGFFSGPDGAFPSSALVADSAGNLYGTTIGGGGSHTGICYEQGCGIIFKLSPTGVETILYAFTGGADGLAPNGLTFDSVGNLYGTARWGGQGSQNGQCCGTVFKLARNGTFTTLYTFPGGVSGEAPAGSLVLDRSGNLYGATSFGGNTSACIMFNSAGCGVLFKIDTSGNETVLYTFTGGADGAGPNGSLLRDSSGNLYGTAFSGGNPACNNSSFNYPGCGVVFELTPSGTQKVLHAFRSAKGDGANPDAGLSTDGTANLFSTTMYGGTYNDGTVFQLNVKGLALLHSFKAYSDGWLPQGGVIRDAAGNLYGTAAGNNLGCPNGYNKGNCGTVFRIIAPPQIAKFTPASGPVGDTVSISGVSLSQTTEVTFNGTSATLTLQSDKLITATVPTGATTGTIAVTSSGGTAISPTTFTVTQ